MPEEPADKQAETTRIEEPGAATPDHDPRPWLQEVKPSAHRKKRVIASIVAAIAVVVFGVGGWAAYALWYQSPDKVVLDALIGAASAKTATASGSITSGTKYHITFEGKTGYKEGSSGTMSIATKGNDGSDLKFDLAGVHSATGDDFVKITNLKTIVDSLIQQPKTSSSKADQSLVQAFYDSLLQPFVAKVDGKWVKVTPDDVKKISGPVGENYDCLEKTIDNLSNDTDKLIEIGTMYWNNNFIVVRQQLGEKAGNFGYVLGIDTDKAKRFAEALKTSKLFQDLKSCSASNDLEPDFSGLNDEAMGRTEVWIDKWNHQLRSVHAVSQDKTVFDMQTTFNQPVTVASPTNALALSEVFSEFTQTLMGGYGSLFKE